MIKKISLVLSLAIPLMACGSSDRDATDEKDGETVDATEAAPNAAVFDPMLDAMDQAKAVQDTIDSQQDRIEAALEAVENGGGDDNDNGDDDD